LPEKNFFFLIVKIKNTSTRKEKDTICLFLRRGRKVEKSHRGTLLFSNGERGGEFATYSRGKEGSPTKEAWNSKKKKQRIDVFLL